MVNVASTVYGLKRQLLNQSEIKVDKPVDDVVRCLESNKKFGLPVPEIWSNDTLPYPANLTPPMRAGLQYATCCKTGDGSTSA